MRFDLYTIAIVAASLMVPAIGYCQIFERTDPQKEIELGRQAAREIMKRMPLSRNKADQERVQRIGTALIDSMPEKAYPFEFRVLSVPDFNAFCLPGGFMFVYEGLLAKMEDDNAVAFVMAHEITHAAHRHWHRIVEKMKGVSIGAILLGAMTNNYDIASFVENLISLKYSREQEDDADKTGIEMAWTAGFDPKGAVVAARIMLDLEKMHSVPEYLSDHPPAKDRLKRLEAIAVELNKRKRPAVKHAPGDVNVDLANVVGKLPDVPIGGNPWYPLAVSNEWTYEVGGPTGAKSTYAFKIVSVVATSNGPVYRAETTFVNGPAIPCQLLSNADQLWRRNRPNLAKSAWQIECRMDVAEGKEMKDGDAVYTLRHPDPVAIPCGTFTDVLKVHKRVNGMDYDLWFVRGVGLAKRVCEQTGVSEVLTTYRVANPSTGKQQ